MIEKIKNFFRRLLGNWFLVESDTGVWTLSHGKTTEQHLAFFKIYYSPTKDMFELQTEGYRPKDHFMYGQMLKRLAELNNGQAVEKLMNFVGSAEDRIVIVQFGLNNEAEKVFSFCKENKDLETAITKVEKDLMKQNIEIYNRRQNIIATENGFFGAFFESDLSNDNKPPNI